MKIAILSLCIALVASKEVFRRKFSLYDVPEDIPPFPCDVSSSDLRKMGGTYDNFCSDLRTWIFGTTEHGSRFVSGEELPENLPCRLVTQTGKFVDNLKEITDGDHVYVVPEGRPFVWPTYELGHKVDLTKSDHGVILETISLSPRIFRLHNFVSGNDLERLMESIDKLDLVRSTGGIAPKGNNATNGGAVISSRTSTNAWDTDSEISIELKRRVSDLLRFEKFDKDQYGGLQVVHYQTGQYYDFHQDWLEKSTTKTWNWDPRQGGVNRFATVFLYLSDTELGGATGFPLSTSTSEIGAEETSRMEEARDKLFKKNSPEWKAANECVNKFHVKPKKGDAILFYHQDRLGNLDHRALHGACPVLEGEKLGANLWIWNGKMFTHERAEGKGDSMDCIFFNSYGAPIEFFWIKQEDETGWMDLVFNAKIEPGHEFPSGTYSGHSFLAKNMAGDIIGKWEMKTQITYIEIGPQPSQGKAEL